MEPNNAVSIALPTGISMVNLLGAGDTNLREIEKAFPNLEIAVRGETVLASGDRIQILLLEKLLLELSVVVRSGGIITIDAVKRSMKMITSDSKPAEVFSLNILSSRGRTIRPKTANQKNMLMPLIKIQSSLVLDQRELEKLIWQLQKLSLLCKAKKLVE